MKTKREEWLKYSDVIREKYLKKQKKREAKIQENHQRYLDKLQKKEIKKEERFKRVEEMRRLRVEDKLSLEEVGKKLGCTRERIRQLLKLVYGETFVHKKVTIQEISCSTCHLKFKGLILQNRKYCSVKCRSVGARKDPQLLAKNAPDYKKKKAKYANFYYHNFFKKNPNWKNIVSERNKKYAKNKKIRNNLKKDE